MDSILASIIVPIYKVDDYLSECLESIISQTTRNLQIILVDDGSPDNSGAICDSFAAKDSRITVIHKSNGGVSSARNAGLEIAKGKYIYFLDGDDTMKKNLVEKTIRKIESKNYDICSWGFIRVEENRLSKRYAAAAGRSFHFDNEKAKAKFLGHVFLRGKIRWQIWDRVFRRDIIEKYHLRFCETQKIAEDLDFCYRYLLHCGSACCMADCLTYYRVRATSAMGTTNRVEVLTQTLAMSKRQEINSADYIPYGNSAVCGCFSLLAITGDPQKGKSITEPVDEVVDILDECDDSDYFRAKASSALKYKQEILNAYGLVYGKMVYSFYEYALNRDKKKYKKHTSPYYFTRRIYLFIRDTINRLVSVIGK